MIPALIAMLFLGGSSYMLLDSIDIYRDRAKDAIVEPDQRKLADDIFDQMEDSAKTRKGILEDTTDKLSDLAKVPDPGVAGVEAAMAVFWPSVETYSSDFIKQRFELKKHVTRDEWEAVFAAPPDED